jgi:hypothetical protein
MESQEFAPDTEEALLTAFRVLDPGNKGYIAAGELRELLTNKGTAFREKEMESTSRGGGLLGMNRFDTMREWWTGRERGCCILPYVTT